MKNENIFVIDDDPHMLNYIEDYLSGHNFNAKTFHSPVEALEAVDKSEPDLVISDVKMNELTGDDVLNKLRQDHPSVGIILITGFGNIPHSVRAIRKGAFDYITKPFNGKEFLSRVEQYFNNTVTTAPPAKPKIPTKIKSPKKTAIKTNKKNNDPEKKLIGEHASIRNLLSLLPQIAPTDASVMIQGESGTGKEVYANLLQHHSKRADEPFIKINCANLPTELVESTLFGHVKGAFTGATEDKKGAFEEADGGTLLLDEVTEIDISLQAKLLRVLQEKEFHRVGVQKMYKSDVRIISTTNRNIANAIAENEFRKDLYYRLNTIPVQIPPLRVRKDDIPALADSFCTKYAKEYNLPVKDISDDVIENLMQKDWEGNVRELEHHIQRGVIMAGQDKKLTMKHVENPLFQDGEAKPVNEEFSDIPVLPIETMEIKMIKKALKHTNGNQKEAAKLLEISDRTIRNKLKSVNIPS